jgi:hypothetical protein
VPRRHLRWGILLAAVLTVATVMPAGAAPKPSGEFLALTYNVAGLPQGISGSDPQTNSPLISPLLNAYDLVLTQEDWKDPLAGLPIGLAYHDEIVSQAKHPYQPEPADPPLGTDLRRFPTGPPLIADGLNMLSDFPLSDVRHEMWTTCYGEFAVEAAEVILGAAGLYEPIDAATGLFGIASGGAADCGAQKGFTLTQVTFAPGVVVDVYDLHGEAGSGPKDRAASVADFDQLARFILEHSSGHAVIVGGDTNLHTDPGAQHTDDSRTWKEFQDATGVLDVCGTLDCGADAGVIDKFASRSGGGVTLTPLSHTFERKRFTRPDGQPLSDHDPLAVRFSWEVSK